MNTNNLPAEIIPSYPSPEYYRWYFCGSLASAQLFLDMARTLGKSEEIIARRMDAVEQIRHDMRCQNIDYTEEDLVLARLHSAQKALVTCRCYIEEQDIDDEDEGHNVTRAHISFYESILAAANIKA